MLRLDNIAQWTLWCILAPINWGTTGTSSLDGGLFAEGVRWMLLLPTHINPFVWLRLVRLINPQHTGVGLRDRKIG
jgi:hypothetical protein